ncbi:hypothetical protein FOZ62_005823 [Perkinsus olseni]|uniref:Uncharacterized protein n=1 Tax=Perkinsus olseni TaxID=32597 RepID=A0A7J6QQ04_PEROL|nr:hypothetical protein FOZ62_005823 [Perkinsus olseni]
MVLRTLCGLVGLATVLGRSGKRVTRPELAAYLGDGKERKFDTCGDSKEYRLYISEACAEFKKIDGKTRVKFTMTLGEEAKDPGTELETPWLMYTLSPQGAKGMILGPVPGEEAAYGEFEAMAAEQTRTDGSFRAFVIKPGVTYDVEVGIGGQSIWTAVIKLKKASLRQRGVRAHEIQ